MESQPVIVIAAGVATVALAALALREKKRPNLRTSPQQGLPDVEPQETPADDMMDSLRSQRDRLMDRRYSYQKIYYLHIGYSILVMSSFLMSPSGFSIQRIILSVLVTLMLLVALAMIKSQLHNTEEALEDLDFAIDLQRYQSTPRESKAEKMLRINSTQLRRYYELNLQQNKWIFLLGIGCILLGVGLIGLTLYLVVNELPHTEDKIICAVLGSVGAFLTNFIAAMYLKMNSTAAQNLAGFHTQLVKTHEVLITNLLAAGIDNDEKRWAALSDLSLKIAGPKV
jgi:hypothetical protein